MGIGSLGNSLSAWQHQQKMYEAEMQRRAVMGVPDNGHAGFNNPERPMKNITPKPAVERSTKIISGPIKRITK